MTDQEILEGIQKINPEATLEDANAFRRLTANFHIEIHTYEQAKDELIKCMEGVIDKLERAESDEERASIMQCAYSGLDEGSQKPV